MIRKLLLAGAVAGSMLSAATPAMAQASDQYLGQMMLVPYTFCPRQWTEANGQTLAISANSALFSLLGTNYGGNGVQNFQLPNLQGRTVLHTGTSPFGSYAIGQTGGANTATLTVQQMPAHTHAVMASNSAATRDNPTNSLLADFPEAQKIYYQGAPDTTMSAQMIGNTGNGQPFPVQNPYLVMRWCIALQGVFPSRG